MSGFKKAERKQVKLKLGLAGPSGSGKTYSALRIAKGLLEQQKGYAYKIALIDSENKSASLYAGSKGIPEFDTLELEPPYTVDKYIAAIELAVKEKYDLLIVDSVSHVWSGEGGLLQEKETLDARGGNSFTNWAKMTPKWNKFLSAILHSDVHMICTMRSKQEHALTQNDKGKSEVKKMGMAPQVREGFEYELTAVFDMDMSHHAQASKDRTNLFDGRTWKPDEKTGQEIYDWLQNGKAQVSDPAMGESSTKASLSTTQVGISPSSVSGAAGTSAAKAAPASIVKPPDVLEKAFREARFKRITAVLNPVHWPKGALEEYTSTAYGVSKFWELSDDQFEETLVRIKSMTGIQAKVQAKIDIESKKNPDPGPTSLTAEESVPHWDPPIDGIADAGRAG